MVDTGSTAISGRTSEELADFLRDCMYDLSGHRLGRHVDLNLGGIKNTSREGALYALLGVKPSTQLLLGVSWVTNDRDRCRAAHGEPRYRGDLTSGDGSALAWAIWKASSSALRDGPLGAASLVLPADDPQWVLFTEPAETNPMLFTAPGPCPNPTRRTRTHLDADHRIVPPDLGPRPA